MPPKRMAGPTYASGQPTGFARATGFPPAATCSPTHTRRGYPAPPKLQKVTIGRRRLLERFVASASIDKFVESGGAAAPTCQVGSAHTPRGHAPMRRSVFEPSPGLPKAAPKPPRLQPHPGWPISGPPQPVVRPRTLPDGTAPVLDDRTEQSGRFRCDGLEVVYDHALQAFRWMPARWPPPRAAGGQRPPQVPAMYRQGHEPPAAVLISGLRQTVSLFPMPRIGLAAHAHLHGHAVPSLHRQGRPDPRRSTTGCGGPGRWPHGKRGCHGVVLLEVSARLPTARTVICADRPKSSRVAV